MRGASCSQADITLDKTYEYVSIRQLGGRPMTRKGHGPTHQPGPLTQPVGQKSRRQHLGAQLGPDGRQGVDVRLEAGPWPVHLPQQ